jgi:hypothetical protein
MKLKNFNWNEQAIDQVLSDETRYTTYTGYGSSEYVTEATLVKGEGEAKQEELTSL